MGERCSWTYDDYHYKWDTACGHAFWFEGGDDTPANSDFKFCCFCGEALYEVYDNEESGE